MGPTTCVHSFMATSIGHDRGNSGAARASSGGGADDAFPHYCKRDVTDPCVYDVVSSSSSLGLGRSAEMVVLAYQTEFAGPSVSLQSG